MIINKLSLLVALCVLFVTNSFAQRPNYSIKNSLGPFGGIVQSNIKTDNFITDCGKGLTAGLTAIVNVEHKWYDVSYGIQFTESAVALSGRLVDDVAGNEMIDMKLSGAQLGFLMHGKIIGQNLTIDFGPLLQANGFFEPAEKEKEEYFVNGYDDLQVKELRDVSKFNINGAVGATAGLKNFRVRVQYQYGLTNVFAKLNDQQLNVGNNTEKFKGNQSNLVFTALLLL
ncbi:MAG: hypothetical protein HKO72_06465 [Flavobacteriaceae bacterium]|nr:hypothetical protein [Bacteroidia bacterium]NNL60965.1 hypothetical protein [Flavobacteriaceae bacterium]